MSDPTGMERARAVADAVLYEGYLLYPYRRSSAKNRVRWQFGVLAPRAWIAAQGVEDSGVAGSAESWYQQAELLLEAAAEARLHLRLRFLQLQARTVEERTGGGWTESAALQVEGTTHVPFEEAVPHDVDVRMTVATARAGSVRHEVAVAGGEDVEMLRDAQGRVRGRVVRRRTPLRAVVTLHAEAAQAPFPLLRVRVRTENCDDSAPRSREAALQRALVATHCLVTVDRGAFLSLLDPPEWAAAAARACCNVHVFPVLAGEAGTSDTVLAAPIILYDHPRVAPESPGDLFDATEIDEILSLRTRTLTDEEKREVRATDPRGAALLDRVEAMPPEVMGRLHGAVRSLRPAGTVCVSAAGAVIRAGDRVVLRPRRHTDVMDAALEGRVALVESIEVDFEDRAHLAVVLDDDPGRDMGMLRHPAHRFFFGPDDVEPLEPAS